MASSDIVASVAQKVERLIGDNRRLRSESVKLTERNEKLRNENHELTERVAMLQKRLNILELKQGLSSTGDNKNAVARVNRLMREVDKCIALLNSNPG